MTFVHGIGFNGIKKRGPRAWEREKSNIDFFTAEINVNSGTVYYQWWWWLAVKQWLSDAMKHHHHSSSSSSSSNDTKKRMCWNTNAQHWTIGAKARQRFGMENIRNVLVKWMMDLSKENEGEKAQERKWKTMLLLCETELILFFRGATGH